MTLADDVLIYRGKKDTEEKINLWNLIRQKSGQDDDNKEYTEGSKQCKTTIPYITPSR
jgi:hypothetical protein